MFLSRALLLLSVCVSLPAVADTVWLDNGDRLSGEIELLDSGKLVIKTNFAGEVTVDVKRIRTLESDKPLLVKTPGASERALSIMPSDTEGNIRLANGAPEPLEVKVTDIQQMMVPQPVIEDWVWEGKATAALDIKNTESKQRDLDLGLTAQARHGDWRHVLGGDFERDYRNGVKSRHVWQADYDLSWFFAEKWFWQTSLSYQRDHISEIEERKQFGMGPGYEWWNNALGRFETAARIDHLRLDNRDGTTNSFNALGLEWDWRRFIFGKRFEVFHNAETLVPDDPTVNYVVDAELGLRYRLNSWASLSLLTEWDYLNSTNSQESVNDTRYRFGLGVTW